MACVNKSDYLLSLEVDSEDKYIVSRTQDLRSYSASETCHRLYRFKYIFVKILSLFMLLQVADFPAIAFHIVSYLVLTHCFFINDRMEAYKSLSTFKYFETGFVQNCKSRKIGKHIFVFGQVKRSQRVNNPPMKVRIVLVWQVILYVGALLYALEYMHQDLFNEN